MSHAQLSHPFSHSYSKPCVIHTKLDMDSTERLIKLYVDCVSGGLDEIPKRMSIEDEPPPKAADPRDHLTYVVATPKAAKSKLKRRRKYRTIGMIKTFIHEQSLSLEFRYRFAWLTSSCPSALLVENLGQESSEADHPEHSQNS